jgi:hypothetical protein
MLARFRAPLTVEELTLDVYYKKEKKICGLRC